MSSKSSIPAPNAMLLGGVGSGKTTALRSLIDGQTGLIAKTPINVNTLTGITVFAIFTEPSFEVVADIPCDYLHWIYIPPASPSFETMKDSAEKINQLDLKTLSSMSDINKSQYNQFVQVLTTLHKFTCQRCGKDFGDVSTWGTNRALWFDSLSGLNTMAMNLVVGSKPVKSMSDWGIAMDNEERLIQKLCCDKRAWFVLTAHVERERDEQTGFETLMAATLGRKLAPRLPRFFSDVVLAKREGDKFAWSTTATGVDLKARNLPFSDVQVPSFQAIINSWKSRGGIIESE